MLTLMYKFGSPMWSLGRKTSRRGEEPVGNLATGLMAGTGQQHQPHGHHESRTNDPDNPIYAFDTWLGVTLQLANAAPLGLPRRQIANNFHEIIP